MSATGLPNLTTATGTSNTNNSPASTATSAAGSSATNTKQSSATGSSSGATAVSSATGLPNIGDSSTVSSSASISVSQITNAPSLSSGNGGILSLTGLPTLSGAFSYPPASVPPTSNAPYMETSRLPQNFVFIIVGGVLAFSLLVVVLWRFITAWSINRSFKKDNAAMYTPLPDLKKRPAKAESGMDMADLSGAKLPKSFNSVPNLFFSPTAEVARQSMIRPQSQHMPGGHYRDASRG